MKMLKSALMRSNLKLLTKKSNLLKSSNKSLREYKESKLLVLSTRIARTNIRESKMMLVRILMTITMTMKRERFHHQLEGSIKRIFRLLQETSESDYRLFKYSSKLDWQNWNGIRTLITSH